MVLFDSSVLIDLLNKNLPGDRRARLDDLIKTLEKSRTKIIIPTPALSELLARADKARDAYYRAVTESSRFRVAPFSTRAAMECALLIESALTNGDKKNQSKTWAKAKFDWQIASIAKCENVTTIYSDDDDIARISKRLNIKTVKIQEIPLPEAAKQGRLELPAPL